MRKSLSLMLFVKLISVLLSSSFILIHQEYVLDIKSTSRVHPDLHPTPLQEARFMRALQGPYRGGAGGSRGSDAPPPTPHTPTSNYRVPPAHRFHKYKLRLLYYRMQKLTPYSIKFIKKNLEEHGPRPF